MARSGRGILWCVLALATLAKVWLATHTIGTNDVRYWHYFMDYLGRGDSVSIYRDVWFYNHPPMVSLLLGLLRRATASAPAAFPFLVRLPAILADVGSALLVLDIGSRFLTGRRAVAAAVVVAASPVLLFVSGFHGNSDPVFVMLLLAAADLLFARERPVLAGLAFGLAFNVKIVPVVCVPLFLLFVPGWKERLRFFGAAALPVVAGFGYHFVRAPQALLANVFLYGSLQGNWGVTKLLRLEGASPYGTSLRLAMAAGVTAAVALLAFRARGTSGPERLRFAASGLGLTFLAFLVLTPGFGVQYLGWLALTSVFLGLAGSIVYNVLAGSFLFAVYTYWCGGLPWHFADSDAVGPWRGVAESLDAALWLFLLLWLWTIVVLLARRPAGAGPGLAVPPP